MSRCRLNNIMDHESVATMLAARRLERSGQVREIQPARRIAATQTLQLSHEVELRKVQACSVSSLTAAGGPRANHGDTRRVGGAWSRNARVAGSGSDLKTMVASSATGTATAPQ